jgi:hypothetical protein
MNSWKEHQMSIGSHAAPAAKARTGSAALAANLWLMGAGLVGLLLYYFIGIDQGATSLFGADTHIHEFVHDARHLLGFPCH